MFDFKFWMLWNLDVFLWDALTILFVILGMLRVFFDYCFCTRVAYLIQIVFCNFRWWASFRLLPLQGTLEWDPMRSWRKGISCTVLYLYLYIYISWMGSYGKLISIRFTDVYSSPHHFYFIFCFFMINPNFYAIAGVWIFFEHKR